MKKNITFFAVLVILILSYDSSFSQTQIGNDIYAELPGDRFGTSVSMSSDGSRVAVGAPSNSGAGNLAGHVRVLEWDGTAWTQIGSDIDGKAAGDRFGTSVSISADGNRVAVGARFNDGGGNDAGHVRVFEWDGNDWLQLGADIDGQTVSGYSGSSVSLSADGKRVAVGAPQYSGNELYNGRVRVFQWNGSAWAQIGGNIDGETGGDNLGGSVSLSSNGSRLAVGARKNQENGTWSGQVKVFGLAGNNWVQSGADILGGDQYDFLGSSVSLSSDGNRVAVGATQDEVNGTPNGPGYVRVFQWTGSNWVKLGNDVTGETNSDQFGSSVSLSQDGNKLVVGAWLNDGNGTDAGHARLYEWNVGTWGQIGMDIDGEAGEDYCGFSVSLSSDGNRVAIGATENDGGGFDGGQVRVFGTVSVPTGEVWEKNNIEIFPNPANRTVHIIGDSYETVKVVDGLGRVLLTENKDKQEIDVSNLPDGMYFILIGSDGNLAIKKLIKN